MSQKKQFLIVLDLNGTLLCRIKKSSEKQRLRANPYAPKEVSFLCNTNQVYLRPHISAFLDSVFTMPHIAVAVWTSAQRQNAVPLCEMVFGKKFMPKLVFSG